MEGELCCQNCFYRKKYLGELLSSSAFKVFKPTARRKQAMLSTTSFPLGFSSTALFALLPRGAVERTGRYPARVTGAQRLQQTREHTQLTVLAAPQLGMQPADQREIRKTWRQSLMRHAFYSESGLLELFYYSSYSVRFKDLICLRVLILTLLSLLLSSSVTSVLPP